MTADELRTVMNNKFGLDQWPKTYEVDAETYGRVVQEFFNWAIEDENEEIVWKDGDSTLIRVALGPNNGFMFKNVELLIIKPPILEDVKCPQCGGKMTSRKNRETGSVFWGCNNYPNCRGTRDSMGRSKEEREAEKNRERPPGRWNVT